MQDLGVGDIQLPVAQIGDFRAVLQEAQPVIGDPKLQFVADFSDMDLAVHESDILADLFKIGVCAGGHGVDILGELRELDGQLCLYAETSDKLTGELESWYILVENGLLIYASGSLNGVNTYRCAMVELQTELAEDADFARLNSHEKMRKLLGHVQLDIMIVDEAIKLQQVINKGFVSLVVAGRNKRDRIVACEYGNYFFHLKELEMIKNQQQQDWNIEDWQLWGKTS